MDGCLLTLNKSKNLEVILLTSDKLKKLVAILLTLAKLKKISSFLLHKNVLLWMHELLQKKKQNILLAQF